MKNKLFSIIFITISGFITTYALSQNNVQPADSTYETSYIPDTLFNEYIISVNRTNLNNYNTNDRFGFGIGLYHVCREQAVINIVIGAEYNRTSQFKKYMPQSHFSNYQDLTYTIDNIALPVALRFNIGKKVKVFAETGFYLDVVVNSNVKGTKIYTPNSNNQSEKVTINVNEHSDISTFNYGFNGGIGLVIPLKKFEFVIKSDYKYGIRNLYDKQDDIYNRYYRISLGIRFI